MEENQKYVLETKISCDSHQRLDLSYPSIDSIHKITPSSGQGNCFMLYSASNKKELLCKIGILQTFHSLELWFNDNAWTLSEKLEQSALQLCLSWIFSETSEADVWIMAREKEAESKILQFGFQKLEGCRPSEQWYVINRETWRTKKI